MSYRKSQYCRVEHLLQNSDVFGGDQGGGEYRKKSYPFILQKYNNNLYGDFREAMLQYFSENGIAWWGGTQPTTHPLSSQVSCLNHLFSIREDKNAVLSIMKSIDPKVVDALKIETDRFSPAYIQFEAVSDTDHLNERASTRGSNCTSLDALMYGKRESDSTVLFPIEWKYTEVYGNDDKAKGNQGATRKQRYTSLINESQQLLADNHSIYYFEPFYQLMRQTLWAEQMVFNRDTETLKVDDFLHIHVVPQENEDLLNKVYPCSGMAMETTWRSCLRDQGKYRIITPQKLLEPLDRDEYGELLEYLRVRYWNPLSLT
ncbi:MAG: hypothetical protein FWE41_01695 [Coriobacteriia bacterium]|nr:hypothetical protein [Coriobacteriia bacterium]